MTNVQSEVPAKKGESHVKARADVGHWMFIIWALGALPLKESAYFIRSSDYLIQHSSFIIQHFHEDSPILRIIIIHPPRHGLYPAQWQPMVAHQAPSPN